MTDRFDPLETSALITDGYRRYLRSLLPVRDPRIATALEHEISTSELLTKGPLLEATPPYERGATLDTLIGERVLSSAFRKVSSDALPFGRPLYKHQEQAIRKVAAGRNVVVATGTGSGKTESFLLPILDALSAEHARAGTLGPGVRSPRLAWTRGRPGTCSPNWSAASGSRARSPCPRTSRRTTRDSIPGAARSTSAAPAPSRSAR